MNLDRLKRVDLYILIWAGLIVAASTPLADWGFVAGAFAGGAVALANWMVMRYLLVRLIAAPENRSRFGIFLGVKTAAVLGAVTILMVVAPFDVLGFIIGLSALVLGIFTHSLRQVLAAGDAALKEDG